MYYIFYNRVYLDTQKRHQICRKKKNTVFRHKIFDSFFDYLSKNEGVFDTSISSCAAIFGIYFLFVMESEFFGGATFREGNNDGYCF
mmetsp:Transcript_21265/g.29474  ORF Transcript_21265/g.29474 Transcript_21265/m.29474 type:complete len:87 (+) Transcript_21265:220-480(+)